MIDTPLTIQPAKMSVTVLLDRTVLMFTDQSHPNDFEHMAPYERETTRGMLRGALAMLEKEPADA